mgnify:FL=1
MSQLTNGKFQITNYGEGEVCAANAVFDTVQDGTVQCAGDWAGYWAGKDPAFELLSTTIKKTAVEVYEEEAANNPNFKMVYDSMKEYCKVVDPYRGMLNNVGYGFGFTHDFE